MPVSVVLDNRNVCALPHNVREEHEHKVLVRLDLVPDDPILCKIRRYALPRIFGHHGLVTAHGPRRQRQMSRAHQHHARTRQWQV